jgi:MFS family permease
MFVLGVVTLGSSSLTLMEPTLPLYLQTTYKVMPATATAAAGTAACSTAPQLFLAAAATSSFVQATMTSIGLMFAVGILVYGFSAPASGWLSDRLGRIQVTFGACRAVRLWAYHVHGITHVRSWAWASSCSACPCRCWCCPPPSQALALHCASWVFPARLRSLAPCLRCHSPPISHSSRHTLQLAAEVERMGAASGGVSVSLDAVYSMFNTACAATFRATS